MPSAESGPDQKHALEAHWRRWVFPFPGIDRLVALHSFPATPDTCSSRAVLREVGGMFGWHRSMRDVALLGAGVDQAGSRCPPHAAKLRQTVREASEERHGRCRSDLRGGDQTDNAIRGHMAEFGVVAPVGREGLLTLTDTLHDEADDRVPAEARQCLQMLAAQLRLVNAQILENDRSIRVSARATDVGRRLMGIPGVGPLLASAFVATVPDPHAFRSGRNLAAWIGLVPRQNSSGGKERLGGITKQGNRYLRQLLFVGAMAVIRYAERHGTRRPWLVQLLARRTTKVAAAALANKTARMIWAIMASGQKYREPHLRAS
jgi:Transposase IS116/IS110/IS902 family